MTKKQETLFLQNNPGKVSKSKKYQYYKISRKWCKVIFKTTFRVLELLRIILEIVQYVCEILKK